MKNQFDLSKTEMEIMEKLWTTNNGCTFGELLSYFNEKGEKNWKKQTMNTFLTRLMEKGLVKREKLKTTTHYFASVSRKEHIKKYAQGILDIAFDSSLQSFISALNGGDKISNETMNELKDYINNE